MEDLFQLPSKTQKKKIEKKQQQHTEQKGTALKGVMFSYISNSSNP